MVRVVSSRDFGIPRADLQFLKSRLFENIRDEYSHSLIQRVARSSLLLCQKHEFKGSFSQNFLCMYRYLVTPISIRDAE